MHTGSTSEWSVPAVPDSRPGSVVLQRGTDLGTLLLTACSLRPLCRDGSPCSALDPGTRSQLSLVSLEGCRSHAGSVSFLWHLL